MTPSDRKYLQTTTPVSSEDDIPSKIRKQMLLTVGYKQEEIEKLNLSETSDDAVRSEVPADHDAGLVGGRHPVEDKKADAPDGRLQAGRDREAEPVGDKR